jgi:hypothetical protein
MVIFASSIGRSGTRYLAELFSRCTDAVAEHAAEPLCNGQVMIDVYNGIARNEVEEKAQIIAEIVASRCIYFESNQLFTRILAGTFLDRFPSVSIIHLLRDPVEIACSYMNRKSYPSHTDRPWRLPLNLERALFKFPESMTPFQENLCDWLENELRYLELKSRFDRIAEFRFADIQSVEHICELFDSLDVPYRRGDVIYHTAKQDLDRNANRRKTRISQKYLRQTQELIETLRQLDFPVSGFRQNVYEQFEFTRQLIGR